MSYVATLAVIDSAQERRVLRKEQQARREARYDQSHGVTLTPKDAEDFARLAPTNEPMVRVYWKEYAKELRRMRLA